MPSPAAAPRSLHVAVLLSALGALLGGISPLVGLVAPAMPTGFPSWPLLVVLALLPAALAASLLRRPGVAAAVLLGQAVLAPGRFASDAQLAVDPGYLARPELLHATTLDPLAPATGTWVLLAGHVLTVAAGVCALIAGRRLFEHAGGGLGSERARTRRQGLLAVVLCAAVVAAVGLLMGPFTSTDPYLLAKPVVEAPVAVAVGSLLLAIAVPTAAGVFAGATDPELVRGGLLGLAAALLAVVVPPLVSVAVLDHVDLGWGPVLGLLAAAALVALSFPGGRAPDRAAADVRLPALTRLLTAAGASAVLAGGLAVAAALTKHLEMPIYLDDPSPYPARLLWPGAIALVVLGVAALVPRTALVVRPALALSWALLPPAGAAALDTVLTATQVAEAHAGPGAWISGAAMLVAAVAAVLAAIAGGVERDDVDLTEQEWRPAVAIPAGITALLSLAAVFLPVLTAPGYTPPGIFTEFGTSSWGQIAVGAAVLGALAVAPRCRPERAVALLGGAALVMAVRAVEFPLTAGRIEGSAPGLGAWFAAAAALGLLITAGLAWRGGDGPSRDMRRLRRSLPAQD